MEQILRLADLNIKFERISRWRMSSAMDYISEPNVPIDFSVTFSDEDVEEERAVNFRDSNPVVIGDMCLYRNMARHLPDYDAFLLHAAVVSVDGNAYAFAAHSGMGKSTHVGLWKQVFGNCIKVINGDKPIVRFLPGEETPYVYGTPWAGKEAWNTNMRAPLKAVCFVERGENNEIHSLPKEDAAVRIMHQVLHSTKADRLTKQMELLNRMLLQVDTYLMHCNMSPEAAKMSFETMSGNSIDKIGSEKL